MEQHEIDELQAYINQYFKNKKIITMQNYSLIERVDSDPLEYVSGVLNGQPVFDTNKNNAVWDWEKRLVDDYVTDNNIQNVKVKTEGGNHPTKPPLSA